MVKLSFLADQFYGNLYSCGCYTVHVSDFVKVAIEPDIKAVVFYHGLSFLAVLSDIDIKRV